MENCEIRLKIVLTLHVVSITFWNAGRRLAEVARGRNIAELELI
jgi:hypothetical protein